MKFSSSMQEGFETIDETPLFFTSGDMGLSLPDDDIDSFKAYWNNLPIDEHAEKVQHVRYRRHAVFQYDQENNTLIRQAHATYYQGKAHNRIYGGTTRSFAPIEPWFLERFGFVGQFLGKCAKNLPIPNRNILIHCHFMRIPVDVEGRGYPSPESIHQDGFDYISLHMIQKINCRGGQSIVTRGDNEIILAPYLGKFLDSLLINDKKFYHAALPIFRIEDGHGCRDTMLASYQAA